MSCARTKFAVFFWCGLHLGITLTAQARTNPLISQGTLGPGTSDGSLWNGSESRKINSDPQNPPYVAPKSLEPIPVPPPRAKVPLQKVRSEKDASFWKSVLKTAEAKKQKQRARIVSRKKYSKNQFAKYRPDRKIKKRIVASRR